MVVMVQDKGSGLGLVLRLGLGLSILAGINGWGVNGLSTQTSWDRGEMGNGL